MAAYNASFIVSIFSSLHPTDLLCVCVSKGNGCNYYNGCRQLLMVFSLYLSNIENKGRPIFSFSYFENTRAGAESKYGIGQSTNNVFLRTFCCC